MGSTSDKSTTQNTAVKAVLVGHSAAGKTACAALLNGSRRGDMDVGLGTTKSPPLDVALTWLLSPTRPSVVVLSNHEEMLTRLRFAKVNHEQHEAFSRLMFLYLHKPKERLKRHLARPTCGGSNRPLDAQRYTLDHYDRFHMLFSDIADAIIDCSTRSTQQTADVVRSLLMS